MMYIINILLIIVIANCSAKNETDLLGKRQDIPSKFIMKPFEETVRTNPVPDYRIITAKGGLKLRSQPSVQGEIITLVPEGEVIKLLAKTNVLEKIDNFNDIWIKASTRKNEQGYLYNGYLCPLNKCNDYRKIKEQMYGICNPECFSKEKRLIGDDHGSVKMSVNLDWGNDRSFTWSIRYGVENHLVVSALLSDNRGYLITYEGVSESISYYDLSKIQIDKFPNVKTIIIDKKKSRIFYEGEEFSSKYSKYED